MLRRLQQSETCKKYYFILEEVQGTVKKSFADLDCLKLHLFCEVFQTISATALSKISCSAELSIKTVFIYSI